MSAFPGFQITVDPVLTAALLVIIAALLAYIAGYRMHKKTTDSELRSLRDQVFNFELRYPQKTGTLPGYGNYDIFSPNAGNNWFHTRLAESPLEPVDDALLRRIQAKEEFENYLAMNRHIPHERLIGEKDYWKLAQKAGYSQHTNGEKQKTKVVG